MLSAGQRNNRVRFERRIEGDDDGSGNVLPETWTALKTVWAGFRPEFGREKIAAGRLESTLTGTLTVLAFAETKGVTPADRVVFVTGPYTGKACQIHSMVATPDGREIEMLLEEGAAT